MSNLAKDASSLEKKNYDFEQIANNKEFKGLMTAKKKFLIPLSLFFLVFYFMLPILTSYTTILNKPAIGSITWTWVYALSQFVMTWALCIIYVKKAGSFDSAAIGIIKDHEEKGEKKV